MFEQARADIERARRAGRIRSAIWCARSTLRWIFTRPLLLRALGRLLRWYQAVGPGVAGAPTAADALAAARLRELEPLTPRVQPQIFRCVDRAGRDAAMSRAIASGCSPAACRI